MNKVIEKFKEQFSNYILMFEKGSFINVYSKDSYIISYLLNYKMKKVGENYVCGFPKASLNKVIGILDSNNINYIHINKSFQYTEETKSEFKYNKYIETYNLAFEEISFKQRILKLNTFLLQNKKNKEVLNNFTLFEYQMYGRK